MYLIFQSNVGSMNNIDSKSHVDLKTDFNFKMEIDLKTDIDLSVYKQIPQIVPTKSVKGMSKTLGNLTSLPLPLLHQQPSTTLTYSSTMDNDMEDLMKGMDSLNSLTSSTRIVLLDTYGRAGVTTTRSLVIKPSNAGGLGIFTTEKIFAGEEIFRIDNPQFYFSFQEEEEEESKNVTCDFCLHSILSAVDKDGHIWTEACLHPEMKRCRGCYQVAYCSKVCLS